MRTILATLAIALPSVLLAADKKDEDAIQGQWKIEKYDAGGEKPADGAETFQIIFTFKDGKFSLSIDGKAGRTSEYKLDPTTKPKSIDLTDKRGTALGIYELDGDTLKLTLSEGDKATRPTEFKATNRETAVITFKRVKEEKKDK